MAVEKQREPVRYLYCHDPLQAPAEVKRAAAVALEPLRAAVHPTPYASHPTHHTLNPTPYTLHPTPYSLLRTPYTPHPTVPPVLAQGGPVPIRSSQREREFCIDNLLVRIHYIIMMIM